MFKPLLLVYTFIAWVTSVDSYQMALMCWLIWIYSGRTFNKNYNYILRKGVKNLFSHCCKVSTCLFMQLWRIFSDCINNFQTIYSSKCPCWTLVCYLPAMLNVSRLFHTRSVEIYIKKQS
jgi:hypothetical protein